jgi:hypothetical protein
MKSLSRKRQVLAAFYLNERGIAMELRDQIAVEALKIFLMKTQINKADVLAKDAYLIADAMIKQREISDEPSTSE